jgi:hypothetical protein
VAGTLAAGDVKEWGMRALWSKKNDEDAARYQERTIGRLRGLTKVEVKEDSSQADQIRARIERMTAEISSEPGRGTQAV